MKLNHAFLVLLTVSGREIKKFLRQPGRLLSSVIRPLLWMVVFSAGFTQMTDLETVIPYDTEHDYRLYLIPGLSLMICLFSGMQSSLAMVYDREMGVMRLLLTAPLPRSYLLACKLLGGSFLSVLQTIVFLILVLIWDIGFTFSQLIFILPFLMVCSLMLTSFGLVLSVYVKQLENFAGTMNFVIFPMFFLSTALYPIQRMQDAGEKWIYLVTSMNPFTHAIETIRYALYYQINLTSFIIIILTTIVFYFIAVIGYDPQRGLIKRKVVN